MQIFSLTLHNLGILLTGIIPVRMIKECWFAFNIEWVGHSFRYILRKYRTLRNRLFKMLTRISPVGQSTDQPAPKRGLESFHVNSDVLVSSNPLNNSEGGLVGSVPPQGATDDFNPHRCQLGSNDDFLIRNDHWGPKISFIPLEVIEVGNVDM